MERIITINQADVDRHRATLQTSYEGYDKPCPGSVLDHDDDVQWLGFISARVIWGYDDPNYFYAYCPEYFGDSPVPLDVGYVNDRAPADESETPMPLFPTSQVVQQQQQQNQRPDDKGKGKGRGKCTDERGALEYALSQLSPKERKAARDKIRAVRPDLVQGR